MAPNRKPAIPIPASAFGPSSETTVTWLSGAGFLVNCHGTCLLIDPVLTKDPADSAKSECRIVMMRIGVSTSPHAKAGRLAHGSPICKRI